MTNRSITIVIVASILAVLAGMQLSPAQTPPAPKTPPPAPAANPDQGPIVNTLRTQWAGCPRQGHQHCCRDIVPEDKLDFKAMPDKSASLASGN